LGEIFDRGRGGRRRNRRYLSIKVARGGQSNCDKTEKEKNDTQENKREDKLPQAWRHSGKRVFKHAYRGGEPTPGGGRESAMNKENQNLLRKERRYQK